MPVSALSMRSRPQLSKRPLGYRAIETEGYEHGASLHNAACPCLAGKNHREYVILQSRTMFGILAISFHYKLQCSNTQQTRTSTKESYLARPHPYSTHSTRNASHYRAH